MQIREIQPSDVSENYRLRLEALQNAPEAFLTTLETFKQMTQAQLAQRIADNIASADFHFVATFDPANTMVGTMGLVRAQRPKQRHIADIVAVYVTPSQRGKGYASQMLDTLLDHAHTMQGLEIIHLGVNAINTAAIDLYKSRGFHRYGLTKHSFKWQGKFGDELLMVKELNGTPQLSDTDDASVIATLATLIEARKKEQPTGSYTVELLNNQNKAAQKVGEEAVEVVIAALAQTRERVIEESADLLYHLLVLLTTCDVSLSEVEAELAKRGG